MIVRVRYRSRLWTGPGQDYGLDRVKIMDRTKSRLWTGLWSDINRLVSSECLTSSFKGDNQWLSSINIKFSSTDFDVTRSSSKESQRMTRS